MNDLAAVLYEPRLSASLAYCAALGRWRSFWLLEWFVERFRSFVPGLDLYFLQEADSGTSLSASLPSGLIKVATDSRVPLRAMADAARQISRRRVALFRIGLGFAPRDLLTRVYEHHVRVANHYTDVLGLPPGTTPQLYESDFLVFLSSLPLSSLPPNPQKTIQTLFSGAGPGGHDVPNPFRSIRAHSFDALGSYGANPEDLPESVRITEPREMAVGRQVALRLGSTADDEDLLAPLRLWKAASIEAAAARRSRLRRRLARRPSRHRQRPVRVLYVSNSSGFSGAEQSLVTLVEHIDRARFEPHVLVGRSGHFTRRLADVGTIVHCPEHNIAVNSLDNYLYLSVLINEIAPAIVHLNSPSGFPVVCAAASHGARIVTHLHIAHFRYWLEELRVSDVLIAVSEFVKRRALSYDVRESRVVVVPNGVDTAHFYRQRFEGSGLRNMLGISKTQQVVLLIARFAPQKRHELLLQAASCLKEKRRDICVVLVGEALSPMEQECQQRIVDSVVERELGDVVRFLGFQPDVRPILAAADVNVLCSNNEGSGLVILEAMAMECPVVVTNSGGAPEVVDHGENGLVVPPDDPSALAAAVAELLADVSLRRRFGRAGRIKAEGELSAARQAASVMALYERVARHGAGGRR